MIEAAVAREWGLPVGRAAVLIGGMNSFACSIDLPDGRAVAKWVPADGCEGLTRGARVAQRLAQHGVAVGAPRLSLSGTLAVGVQSGCLVVLDWVEGVPLDGDTPEEQDLIGRTLGRVHRVRPVEPVETDLLTWLDVARDVQVEPWFPRAVHTIQAEMAGLPPLTVGLLHTDPSPEAFLHHAATTTTGLIDWDGSTTGPLLYDVASAVMYLGGADCARPFLMSYTEHGPCSADEVTTHLATFRRLRWGVQAAYFAQRLATRDLTGIEDDAGNRQGIDDARWGLQALGVIDG